MKKTLALVLAIVMALGCMSITAFAAEPTPLQNGGEITINNGDSFVPYQMTIVKGETIKLTVKVSADITNYSWVRFADTSANTLQRMEKNDSNEYAFEIPASVYGESKRINFYVHKDEYSGPLASAKINLDIKENVSVITAEITAADFGYTMVIPTTTTLTEANHENVLLGTDGKVSIKDIKHPTEKVIVSYTVDLSNGNLTDGTNTINATYKYKQGDAEFAAIDGTTKVTVYANKTVNDSLVNVTANKDQWNAAPAGTYNASVVFNFDKAIIRTLADVLPTGIPEYNESTLEGWPDQNSDDYKLAIDTKQNNCLYQITAWGSAFPICSLDAVMTDNGDGSYSCVSGEPGPWASVNTVTVTSSSVAVHFEDYDDSAPVDVYDCLFTAPTE